MPVAEVSDRRILTSKRRSLCVDIWPTPIDIFFVSTVSEPSIILPSAQLLFGKSIRKLKNLGRKNEE